MRNGGGFGQLSELDWATFYMSWCVCVLRVGSWSWPLVRVELMWDPHPTPGDLGITPYCFPFLELLVHEASCLSNSAHCEKEVKMH